MTLAHYESILREAGEQYHVLPLQGDARALITRRGGRVLGLFPTPDSENLLWTNSAAWDSIDHFRKFVSEGQWNLGGERIWIAPEIQYNVRDRRDFWGTLSVPPQMDPGEYKLNVHRWGMRGTPEEDKYESANLSTYMDIEAFNIGQGIQQLVVHHDINHVPDPLRFSAPDNLQDIQYFGYRHVVTLGGEDSNTFSEAWNLVQLNAGGHLIIPCAPVVEASDYVGIIPEEAREICHGDVPHLRLNITGKRQYKLGYKSWCMTGRLAYHNTLPDGRAYLLVRSFFNNPSNVYAEEPPDQPGNNGHSVHVYNDGGEFGGDNGFGEMEVTGQTIHGGNEDRDSSNDEFVMWVYVGTPQSIRRIAHLLLGVKL